MGDISLRGKGKAYLSSLLTSVNKNSPLSSLPTSVNKNSPLKTSKASDVVKKIFKKSPVGRIADTVVKVGAGVGAGYEYAKSKFKDKEAKKKESDKTYPEPKSFKKGGSVKDTHVTKDGRVAKKGLYYYMNRAKKLGKSKPGKGTVSDKALKASAKTAKK